MDSYRNYVVACSTFNPCLQNLCNFLSEPKQSTKSCRIKSLDFFAGEDRPQQNSEQVDRLSSFLDFNMAGHEGELLGRLLIVEDITREVIEILGSSLAIDPLFFANHIHPLSIDFTDQPPDEAILPSRAKSAAYTNFHYRRAVVFEKEMLDKVYEVLQDTYGRRRSVGIPLLESLHIGLVQHCVSIWKRKEMDKAWIGVILVDPPINEIWLPGLNEQKYWNPAHISARLLRGGFEDFMNRTRPATVEEENNRLPRDGLMNSLLSYWRHHRPDDFDPQDPTLFSLSYFPLRIVAAEWNIYANLMVHSILQYDYYKRLNRGAIKELEKLDQDLRSLQSWGTANVHSKQKIGAIIRFLRFHQTAGMAPESISQLLEDYDYINDKMDECGQLQQSMIPIVTYLVQILDSRRSFAETANISRLTILALIFVPLTFVAGLFSMNEQIAPGGSKFWLYFAVAIPLTMVVYLIACPPVDEINWALRRSRKQNRAQTSPYETRVEDFVQERKGPWLGVFRRKETPEMTEIEF